jgi:DNA-binding response OmpR family regulator
MINGVVVPLFHSSPPQSLNDDPGSFSILVGLVTAESMQKHVLVVDDYKPFREVAEAQLIGEGYRVSLAEDGAAMRRLLARESVDLVLVDLALPSENGLSLVRFLRENHRCGIIVVSGRNDLTDRVVGLEVGADDYVAKPYETRELLARVNSVLRRVGNTSAALARPAAPAPGREVLAFAHWRFDAAARHLLAPGGEVVELTSGEFNLLSEFIAHPAEVLSRERLLQAVHNRNWDYFDRSIDVLVTRLRRKIEASPEQPAIVKTVRGAGYLFTATVSRSFVSEAPPAATL